MILGQVFVAVWGLADGTVDLWWNNLTCVTPMLCKIKNQDHNHFREITLSET